MYVDMMLQDCMHVSMLTDPFCAFLWNALEQEIDFFHNLSN